MSNTSTRIKQLTKRLDKAQASKSTEIQVVYFDDTMTEEELEQERRRCETQGIDLIIVEYVDGQV